MFLVKPIRNFYARFERPISSFSLVAGFVFDAITLKRVDMWWENFWILLHLVVIGIFIVLIHTTESKSGDEKNPSKAHFWYVNILQFFFGGILSVYLVFYFRSADISATWPFLLLLGLAFWANESLKRHYIRFSFQIVLFFLSIYSFAIFLVPIILHQIGAGVFLLSGFLSFVFIVFFIRILFFFNEEKFTKSKKWILFLILGVLGIVNFLYFTNLIPPIPLSLKDAGAYHSVQRNSNGNYDVTYEDYGWEGYFQLYPKYSSTGAEPVYAYSAIFSPKKLNIDIFHEWQYYNEDEKKWFTEITVPLHVIGGRDGGFRTYSTRSNLSPGKWRVNIKTERNQIIGRIRFALVNSPLPPILTSANKE